MYYSHFGLNQAPFKITPNTDFFFSGGNRGPILEALIYTVTNGEGIVKVTGEVGSGKTMLCNMLQMRLPPHVETVYLAHPNVLPEEILHAIAFELQLGVDRGAPRIEVMHRLHDHLLARHADGRRVVMFVEESQSMPLATLEEIRLLSNLETRNDKLLQIVLFGQPELDENLRRPGIRQLRERVTHSFRLEPLNAAETREYLMFRLRAAGYRGPDLFSPAVIKYIARASRGLTRRINLIADKALLAAFSENTHTVRLSHVKAAVHDSEFSAQRRHRGPHFAWGMMLMVTGAAVGALAYALVLRGSGNAIEADGGVATSVAAARSASTVTTGSGTGPSAGGGPLPTARNAQDDAAPAAKEPTSRQDAATRTPMTVAPAASSRRPSETEPDLVDRRLAATQQWLSDAAQTTYSIQLMGVEDEDQLKHHLNDLAKFIEVNKVFLYRTVANRKASLTVLYGSFSDRRAAQDALEQLPLSLKANRPILRTVRGIRTEIMRHRSS
ncbi:MAG: AAA family ATPase [Betaproteobacteria bacterium]|nr:AAA family ATPase [Betaproteobacteria bacterium]